MENQSKNKDQINKAHSAPKKTPPQPTYEDKPWDLPQYGQNDAKNVGPQEAGGEEPSKKVI